jgi:hypothetical protein
MLRYTEHLPLDPSCPNYPLGPDFWDDPMTIYSGCGDEIAADLEKAHRKKCQRCQAYGLENIEVVEPY